ncbi:TIR domain-containing protein [Micromonospora sp. NPDC048930]|uniref:TIR domain-containing protein n=1 Tax=Micromonospora sp. NPDC048930 TaxID=3364261 RepID=UPI0037249D61
MTTAEPLVAHRVFLSYAYDDHALAQRITQALAQSGVSTAQHWETSSAEELMTRLRENIRKSDVVVVLLSPAAVMSRWVSTEIQLALSRDVDKRGAELIPVLAAPTDVPSALRDRALVDFTEDVNAGLRQLVEQIQATSRTDFSAMSPRAFEELVADLLRAAGFRLSEARHRPEPGVDLRATYERTDPFGSPETEAWLVQAKLYSHQRVSVDAIRQLAGSLAMAPAGTRGLLITNAQLTSVALDYVAELERSPHVRLRVLDGVELKRLLRRFPQVAARHSHGRMDKSEPRADGDS